jgi:TatD family-associated radical SAM protein
METLETPLNYGGLRDDTMESGKIVYFRRGLEKLSLNITNACPNACTFCIRDRDLGWGVSNLYIGKDPSVREITQAYDSALKDVEELGIELSRIKICGYGEPILRFEDLIPISRHIRINSPSNPDIQVTTTGWPYFRHVSQDPLRLKELVNAGVSHIYLSMNALGKSQYDKLVRPGIEEIDFEAFEDSLRFGKFAKKEGLDVTLGFIRIGETTDERVKEFAEEHGFKFKVRDYESN